ncbi:S1C family serine protease [Scatolibacter rhodanostii]|uniref:S1C family serine protease n=1 Tax=Scatolibacter rhodanostii TaxID=2014781 RepID=UPI000C078F1F|nr:trypsin-like peptidase domain-containing protein [Scatolibacter rhodanostii]
MTDDGKESVLKEDIDPVKEQQERTEASSEQPVSEVDTKSSPEAEQAKEEIAAKMPPKQTAEPVQSKQNFESQPVQPIYYGKPPKMKRMPKEKLPLATKVFLWILSLVAIGTTVTFLVVFAFKISPFTLEEMRDYVQGEPYYENPGNGAQNGDNDTLQDTEPEEPKEKPDITVEPNEEGISIKSKPNTEELSAVDVYKKVVASTVTIRASMYVEQYGKSTEPATGTGIIATSDGYIITNSHVVMNSQKTDVKVITNDGKEYDAVVVGVDKTTDLGVIKTNDHNFTPAEFGDANELEIGEWVLAIGNPGGEQFSRSLTRGIISGLNRSVGAYSENGMAYIQTDAAINPGNSGGPLVNMHGQVVGINSSKIASTDYEGMGFAIPVTNAKEIINELFSGGYVKGRTRLGIKGADSDTQNYYFQGLPNGFVIEVIDEESSFTGTEVQVGDVIVSIDETEVKGVNDIANVLLGYKPGDQVKVSLFRPNAMGTGEGSNFEVSVTLLEDKGETQK